LRFEFILGEDEVITMGMRKKERAIIECKSRKNIMNNAWKMAIARKPMGRSPFCHL
jgi:hypothetical protein